MNLFRISFLLAVLTSVSAQARTFDFKTESFAAYFGGTYGTCRAGDSAYGASVVSGGVADKQVSSAASGEFGFVFPGETVSFRFGIEYLMPRDLSDINVGPAGNPYSTVHSKMTALIPMLSVELPAYKTATSRVITGLGVGMAFVSLDNQHVLTTAGKAAYPSLADHTESAAGKALAAQVYGGYETLLSDTATFLFSVGYRYVRVTSLLSTKNTSTFSDANQQDGDELVNAGGGARGVDLSGFFGGVALRFYL